MRVFLPILLPFFAACASPLPASTAPEAELQPSVETTPTSWDSAIEREAAALQARHPDAEVRILVVDLASGSALASAGDVDGRHPTASTIKTLTVLAALRLGLAPDAELDCSGPVEVAGGTVHDASAPGMLSPAGVLVHSSNVGVVRIAERIPWNALLEQVSEVVPLPASASSEREGLSQLIGLTSRLSLRELAEGYRQALADPDHGAYILEALVRAVGPEGTGTQASRAGKWVAGKTGTEQVDGTVDAVFVGVTGNDRPETLVAVAVAGLTEDGVTGGNVAAPAFASIIENAT